jgi:hypothetical protein
VEGERVSRYGNTIISNVFANKGTGKDTVIIWGEKQWVGEFLV